MQTVLEVKNLTKIFGPLASGFTAVDHISFSIGEGEIVGFLGPNGAGKTTTIQMLMGLMTPTSGEIVYFGNQIFQNHREEILQRINSASAYALLPWRMRVWESLTVYAHLYQIKEMKKKINELAEIFEITNLFNKPFSALSAGQRTRVLLVKAFLNDPEMVLLDEPTASLDPDIADSIRKFILQERKKRNLSILITSHNMQEVEEVCDRVVFLNHGKIFAIDTPQGLAKRNKESLLSLMVTDGLKRLIQFVKNSKIKFTESNRFIKINLHEERIAPFLTEIGKLGVEYSEIEIVRPSLEDFFLGVVKEKV